MATAKITLIGLYNWGIPYEKDLFQNINLPTGINKDDVVNTILYKGADFEVLYADFDFMQSMIGIWSTKWYRTIDRWNAALSIDYNPLENYDRMEEWTDKNREMQQDQSVSSDEKSGENINNTLTSAVSNSSGTGNTENKKSAYDSSEYTPFDKSDTSSSGNNASSGIEKAHMSNNESLGHTENNNAFKSSDGERTGRAHGNIGVTTSQQMLQSELDVSRFNLLDEIADLFLTELCIYTY